MNKERGRQWSTWENWETREIRIKFGKGSVLALRKKSTEKSRSLHDDDGVAAVDHDDVCVRPHRIYIKSNARSSRVKHSAKRENIFFCKNSLYKNNNCEKKLTKLASNGFFISLLLCCYFKKFSLLSFFHIFFHSSPTHSETSQNCCWTHSSNFPFQLYSWV